MAVRFIVGVPGSGKTLFAVAHATHMYFDFDKLTGAWKPKSAVRVISNIDGLRFGTDLESLIQEARGVERFFSYEYQKRFLQELGGQVVYILDEVQRYFPRDFKDKNVAYFWQMHRHFGVDCYAITQDMSTVMLELRSIAEYVIRAAPRTLTFFGEFRYRFYGGERDKVAFNTVHMAKDPKLFAAYRSMTARETEGVKSGVRRYVWMALGMMGAIALLMLLLVSSWTNLLHMKDIDDKAVPEQYGPPPPPPAPEKHDRIVPSAPVTSPVTVAPPSPRASSDLVGRIVGLIGGLEDGLVLVDYLGSVIRVKMTDAMRACSCYPIGKLRTGEPFQFPPSYASMLASARAATQERSVAERPMPTYSATDRPRGSPIPSTLPVLRPLPSSSRPAPTAAEGNASPSSAEPQDAASNP